MALVNRHGSGEHRESLVAALAVALLLPLAALAMEADPPDLSGTWATILFYPEIARIPFIGEISITAVVSVLSEVEQVGTDVTLFDTYCSTEVLTSSPILTTEIPDRVMDSLDPDPRTGELQRRDDEWHLVQDWHLEVRGAMLDDPENDPLPTSRFDSRLVDMDRDGHPGFTVPVSALGLVAGDTYVVQRLRYRLAGGILTSHRIEGAVEWTSEQVIVDATDAFLTTLFTQRHDPDPLNHRFVMLRLPDRASCEDVVVVFEGVLAPDAGE